MKVTEGKGKYKNNDQFISSIRNLYLAFNFLGTWPRRNPMCWYKLIWYIQSLCVVFTIFGPLSALIVQRHDTKKIIRNVGLVPVMICVGVKWATFATQDEKIEQLLHFMEQNWTNLEESNSISKSVPKSKHIMEVYSRYANIFYSTSLVSFMFSTIVAEINSFVARNYRDNNTDIFALLPIPNSWYPVDYNRNFDIQFLVVAQTITLLISTLAAVSIDALFVTVTLHLCGQFKILRYFIENITYDSSKAESWKAKIRMMAKRHQLLLRVCENLQESYGLIILEQMVTCTLSICFDGYLIITEMEIIDANIYFVLCTGSSVAGVSLAIFSYCLVGDLLTTQSTAMAMAAYNAQWYNFPRNMSRSLLLVMMRMVRPVELTAAKCIPMSLETFTAIMKAAASYLSVLRTVGVSEG